MQLILIHCALPNIECTFPVFRKAFSPRHEDYLCVWLDCVAPPLSIEIPCSISTLYSRQNCDRITSSLSSATVCSMMTHNSPTDVPSALLRLRRYGLMSNTRSWHVEHLCIPMNGPSWCLNRFSTVKVFLLWPSTSRVSMDIARLFVRRQRPPCHLEWKRS
jgi:hypothetical protein